MLHSHSPTTRRLLLRASVLMVGLLVTTAGLTCGSVTERVASCIAGLDALSADDSGVINTAYWDIASAKRGQ